jgi:hypothetical protein
MDLLEQMATFVRIVEAGSLAAAARQLRLSPAAVSRQLSALETQVIALTRTPLGASSSAHERVSDSTAALLAAYSENPGPGLWPAALLMFTIEPFVSASAGSAACVVYVRP